MPPKSSSNKKSTAVSWYFCEICQAHITSKEREIHEKVCPISLSVENAEVPEFIRSGILYTASVERRTFDVEELQDMPSKYVNNLLFMSEGAIRLAGLHIGQHVVINILAATNNSIPFVRAIWPVPEKFLTTVFVSEEDFRQYWQSFKGKCLKIEALPDEAVTAAKAVQLQLQVDAEDMDLSDEQLKSAARLLKLELKHFIYTKGSRIHFNFFNKVLELVVTNCQAYDAKVEEDHGTLEQALEKLSLDKVQEIDYFQVANTTSIEILHTESDKGDLKTETEHFISKLDIGGVDQQLELVESNMKYALGLGALEKGVRISRGLLLYGPTGCGKTMICEAMCTELTKTYAEAKSHVIRINSSELYSRYLGETEKNLAAYFERAYSNHPQPTLLIIEDVHNLCPKQDTSEVSKRVSIAFASMLDALSHKEEGQHIFVLATTTHIDALSASIRRCGRLDCEVEINAPTPEGRAAILQCLLRKLEKHALAEQCIEEVAQVTHGFVGADLAHLIYTASLLALKEQGDARGTLTMVHINNTLTRIKPSAMREVLIENPNVHWTDIGGLAELKLKLQQAIEWPLLHPDKFRRLGIKPPRGLLMYGPPGCSKTLIAKALATESQLNFLSIKGPELFSMWVGESERAVRDVFRKARQVAPAIVFFDEIDAIGSERADGASNGGSGSSVKERVLTQLLTELDGVETLEDVTIVAATNRPDMIDKALLRPGRIDRIIYVGLPDAEARKEIFQIKLRSMPLVEDVSVEELVTRTEGYSGAEIQAVCHEAALKTLEESFEAEHVSWQQFEYALKAVAPRTSAELLQLYADYAKRS